MATSVVYQTSVPVFIHQLKSLRGILKKGAEWCKANNKDESELVLSRLIEDMNPFVYQVQGCCKCCRLFTKLAPVPSLDDTLPPSSDEPQNLLSWKAESFAELDKRVEITLQYLESLDAKLFEGKEGVEVEFAGLKFDAFSFVQDMLLPNFYFHKSMAYALLRKAGIEVGKWDYLGFGPAK